MAEKEYIEREALIKACKKIIHDRWNETTAPTAGQEWTVNPMPTAMTIKPPKLDAPCKGCEQRSERCHITCDKYKQFGEDLSKFRFYERKQNNDISGMIQSLQNSNTNCRRKSNWR